jgi:hypothetical protein
MRNANKAAIANSVFMPPDMLRMQVTRPKLGLLLLKYAAANCQ